MPTRTQIKELIQSAERRLYLLKERQAKSGLETPPSVIIEIQDIEAQIAGWQQELEKLNRPSSPPPTSPPPASSPDTSRSDQPKHPSPATKPPPAIRLATDEAGLELQHKAVTLWALNGRSKQVAFSYFDLRGRDLVTVDLARAKLNRANFGGADLRMANLKQADLRAAHLDGADLRQADLRGADLTMANFQNADLRGAKLGSYRAEDAWPHKRNKIFDTLPDPERVKILLSANFEGTIYDDDTQWPGGFSPEAKGAVKAGEGHGHPKKSHLSSKSHQLVNMLIEQCHQEGLSSSTPKEEAPTDGDQDAETAGKDALEK